MGEIGDVWNAIKDTASLVQNNTTQNMGARAFACPRGLQPDALNWDQQIVASADRLRASMEWTNRAKEWWGASSGTQISYGVIWTFGGTHSEHAGLYLKDAYLWAVVSRASAGVEFNITGGFEDAGVSGNSAELSGWLRIAKKQFWMEAGTWQYDIRIRGNGSGEMTPLG
jgi:hypothetical protein